MQIIDRIGEKHGRLTVIERLPDKKRKIMWLCSCECGGVKKVKADQLSSRSIKSCGCRQFKAEARAARTARLMRAGNRKCNRCKEVFYRKKDTFDNICTKCKEHCSRCNVKFTSDNRPPTLKRLTYVCKACCAERVKRTKGNAGFNQRDYNLIRKYGITAVEYDMLLKAQNEVCYICHGNPAKRRLAVDHEHVKGENTKDPRLKRPKVRGLLCWSCNNALGRFKDNPEHLRRAADYLETWPAQKILREQEENK